MASNLELGSIAEWSSAVVTSLAIAVALFKESLLGLIYRPRLELRIKSGPPDCHRMHFSSGQTGYYCRFWVFNSGNRVAQDVQVYAASLKLKNCVDNTYQDVDRFLPMNFKWSYGGSGLPNALTTNISPSIGRHCDFSHIIAGFGTVLYGESMGWCTALKLILDLEFDASTRNTILDPGDYSLEVTIAASNAVSKRYSVCFSYDGKWSNDEGVMLSKHMRIEALNEL